MSKLQLLKNLKGLFIGEPSYDEEVGAVDEEGDFEFREPPVFREGIGAETAERLRISSAKRTIFDYCHLIPPFRAGLRDTERIREQVREALRRAVCEKATAEESIISFGELLILCGSSSTAYDPSQVLLDPSQVIETSEKYYKRLRLWRKSVEEAAPEEESIRLSKDVFASESEIIKVLTNLREIYISAANRELDLLEAPLPGDEEESWESPREDLGIDEMVQDDPPPVPGEPAVHGLETSDPASAPRETAPLEPPPDVAGIHSERRKAYEEMRRTHALEEAYIVYKESVLQEKIEPTEKKSKDGNFEMMLQLVQAMSLLQGGGNRQTFDGKEPSPEKEEKKKVARKLKSDGDFNVKDKERLVQLIYNCEASGMKFEKDFETLEAMVYRKPQQVVLMLGQKVDDPVFYK